MQSVMAVIVVILLLPTFRVGIFSMEQGFDVAATRVAKRHSANVRHREWDIRESISLVES